MNETALSPQPAPPIYCLVSEVLVEREVGKEGAKQFSAFDYLL